MRERIFLAAAALIAFGASIGASFHFDDYAIFQDPVLTSPSGWWEVWRPIQTRPLTYFTFWLNYRMGGRNPAGYHAVNLALHIAVVLLLFDVMARLIPRRAAFLGAVLFAVHPIQAEPVVYIFARGTPLNTLFCLLSLRSWIMGRRWIAVAWFAVALLAKEECVAFPLFLFLLFLSISRNPAELRPIAAMLLLSALAGVRVLVAAASIEGAGMNAGISPGRYLWMQGVVILRYFRLLLVPWGFTADPDIQAPRMWLGALAWLTIIALVAASVSRFARAREGFWFIAGIVLMLPSSSLFPVADLAADRRMYLPLIAFAPAAGLLVRNWKPLPLAGIAAALIALSFVRTQVWMTERSLWTEAVARAPRKIRPRIQLSRASGQGEALRLLNEAKSLAPDDPRVAAELGKTLLSANRPRDALPEFGRALALDPRNPQALNNRGVALEALHQDAAARADFERALQLDPCSFDARYNLLTLGVTAPEQPGCRYTPEQRELLSK